MKDNIKGVSADTLASADFVAIYRIDTDSFDILKNRYGDEKTLLGENFGKYISNKNIRLPVVVHSTHLL